MDLLEKASIILTPTAYNNGEALCVKPEDGSGDFDFSRNSAATRVNAQGLVENVQILSSNLVQNGDFSELGSEEVSNGSFSQEGSELVTNGNFDTDSDWVTNDWVISDGVATLPTTSTSNLNQAIGLVQNKFYKIVFTISNTTLGGVRVRLGTGTISSEFTNGTHTIYLEQTTTNDAFRFYADASGVFTGSIDNVSCKEVGQDWSFGTGWSVGEDKAVSDGSQTGNSLLQQASILTLNKTYKVSYELIVTSGSIYARLGFSGAGVVRTTGGTFVEYIECSGNTNFDFLANSSFEGSVTNISVKEVGQNWNLIGTATITENQANIVTASAVTGISQTNILTIGESYKLTYNIVSNNNGGLKISGNEIPSVVGNNTYYFTASATALEILRNSGATDISISNISVIEITDDTNLPRINYEGFSYQDALGSELITNGGFSNGSTDWILNDWTVADGKASLLNGSSFINQNNILEVGKTYKIQYTISDYVSGNIRWRSAGVNGSVNTSNGVVTDYITVASTGFGIQGYNGFTGSISNISAKEYSGQEVVPDSGCGSWLFEPQSTNEIEYSNDYTDAYWIKATSGSGIAPVVTSNYAISPDGTQNADRIQFDATTSGSNADRSRIRTTLSLTDTSDYTFSFYAKSTDGTDQNIGILFDNSQIATFTITDEWQRFEDTATQFGTSSICGLDLRGGIASTSDILVYGIQIEEQSYSTSLIPTDGTTVTRNQDVCTNGGSLATINSTEGTLYFEGSTLVNGDTSRIISLSDGTNDNLIYIRFDLTASRFFGFARGGGGSYTSVLKNGINQTDYNKVALVWNATNFKIWINGSEQDTATINNLPIAMNTLNFTSPTGSNPFYGKTKALVVYKEALSDSELQELTTI